MDWTCNPGCNHKTETMNHQCIGRVPGCRLAVVVEVAVWKVEFTVAVVVEIVAWKVELAVAVVVEVAAW